MNQRMIILAHAIFALSAIQLSAQTTQPVSPLDRVLAKYPSREVLESRVDQFKATNLGDFQAAAADFDLAIRSVVGLEFPISSEGPKPHSCPRKENLGRIYPREEWLGRIARGRAKGTPESLQHASFYEQHLEDFSFDRDEAFRMVALEILVRGWHDWSNWSGAKLHSVRQRVPDIHLVYALREIWPLKTPEVQSLGRDVISVALQIVMDSSHSRECRDQAGTLLRRSAYLVKDEDMLVFCLSELLGDADEIAKDELIGIASAVDDRLPLVRRRVIWLDYLDAPVEVVREMAVEGIGSSIRKPRPSEPPRPEDVELANRLRPIAQSDPSHRVRRMAAAQLRQYDASDTRQTHRRLGVPQSQ